MSFAHTANFSRKFDLTFRYGFGSYNYNLKIQSSTPFSVIINGEEQEIAYTATAPYTKAFSVPGGSIVSLPGALHYKDVPLISYTSASNEPQIYFQSFNSDETLLYYPNSCVFKFPDTWESAYNVEAIYAPGNPYLYGLPSSWKGLHRCQSINLSNCVTTMRGGYAAMPASWEGLDALTGRYAFAGASGEVIVNSSFAGMSYVFTGGTEGYEHLANLEHAAGLFNGCSSWALDASGLYQYLSTKEKPVLDHIGCFSGCSSADGLDQVPADWK